MLKFAPMVYAPRASGLTSLGCLVTRESDTPTQEAKQMTAMQVAGAASRCKARRQQMGIVKGEWKRPTGFCKEPLEMLELLEGKLSRAVLRGLRLASAYSPAVCNGGPDNA